MLPHRMTAIGIGSTLSKGSAGDLIQVNLFAAMLAPRPALPSIFLNADRDHLAQTGLRK